MLTTNEWLPIGSVVHITGRVDYTTIVGYMQQDAETGVLWDYVGFEHPAGFLEPGHDMLFDRDSIDAVLYVGYQSFDGERMKDALIATEESSFAQAKRESREALGTKNLEFNDEAAAAKKEE